MADGCSATIPLDGRPPKWRHTHPDDEPCPLAEIAAWLTEPEQVTLLEAGTNG